jgi:hypothetical protein
MSTINSPFQKAAQQIEAIYASKAQAQTDHINENLTGPLSNSVDIEEGAFAVPVDTLVDLWLLKFGNAWVDVLSLTGDNFFWDAHSRLIQLGHLEKHYLTDRAMYVCRKPI